MQDQAIILLLLWIIEDQDELLTRKSDSEDVASEANNKAILEDIGCNADLYIANQEDNTQIQTFDQCSAELSVKVSKLYDACVVLVE